LKPVADGVELAARAVGEVHLVTLQALYARCNTDAAMVDEVQQLTVDHRAVAVEIARGRRGQAVALGPAEGDVDERACDSFLDWDRQAGEQRHSERGRPKSVLGWNTRPLRTET
jgi:hypothetical protein